MTGASGSSYKERETGAGMPPQAAVKLNRTHRRILEAAIQQNVEPILTEGKQSTVLATQGSGRGIVERRGEQ